MNVGFLLARLDQLKSFDYVEYKKREVMLKRENEEMMIRDLEGSLHNAKEEKKRLDDKIETLNSHVTRIMRLCTRN